MERVFIWDHRLIEREWFPLGRFTVLVGQNDTGKSTVLDALELLLEDRANVEGVSDSCVGWMPTPGTVPAVQADSYVFRGLRSVSGRRPFPVNDTNDHRRVVFDSECREARYQPTEEVRPDVECVRLDLGDQATVHGIVDRYLRCLARRLWTTPRDGWPRYEPDLRLFQRRTDDEPGSWARHALHVLEEATYAFLPPFVQRRYASVVISVDTGELDRRFELLTDEAAGVPERLWSARVALKAKAREEPHDFEHLASGVRPWLLAALCEQSRRLLAGELSLIGDEKAPFAFGPGSPVSLCLYLIDEPERHLHPTAQDEVAVWLHREATTARAELGTAVLRSGHPDSGR